MDLSNLRIGTSGFLYGWWKNVFYPPGLHSGKWLEYYDKYFDTVELNSSFYHVPSQLNMSSWYSRTSEDFLWTLKMNREVTHKKKMVGVADDLEDFYNRASLLKEKLGPILYQFPPSVNMDLVLLEEFLNQLPSEYIHVMEFRNYSWYTDSVFQVLEDYDIAFCVHDMKGSETPIIHTSDIFYLRLHGTERHIDRDWETQNLYTNCNF